MEVFKLLTCASNMLQNINTLCDIMPANIWHVIKSQFNRHNFYKNANNKFMENKLTAWQVVLAIIAGLFVGFINGFLGAGGGMLVVPLLRLIFKQKPKVAHSTAVLVILPVCLVSSIAYLFGGQTDYNMLWQVGIGTFAGGILGTFLLSKLKSDVITILFSLVMIGAGIFMIIKCFI